MTTHSEAAANGPFSKLRGADSDLDYDDLIPQDYEDCVAEQRIDTLLDQFESFLEDEAEEPTWKVAFRVLGVTSVIWILALALQGWIFWTLAVIFALFTLFLFALEGLKIWLWKQARLRQKIYNRSLPSYFGFGDIAKHFAVKDDGDNYDKFVSRYRELLTVGSNDIETRTGKEKLAVVRDWASLAVEMDEKAVTPDDVMDELTADNIRRNFKSHDL
ncbi:hypothetical protein ACX9MK_01940 [Corynebacterium evansiae]